MYKPVAYEIPNPDFRDMLLDEQIEHEINDWAVEGKSGHRYVGRSKEAALELAKSYNYR